LVIAYISCTRDNENKNTDIPPWDGAGYSTLSSDISCKIHQHSSNNYPLLLPLYSSHYTKKMKGKDKIIKYIFIVKLIFFFSSKIEIIVSSLTKLILTKLIIYELNN